MYFDDYDSVMEMLKDDLEMANTPVNEFVSTWQAKALQNRAQQVNAQRNAAGLQGRSGSAKLSGGQVRQAYQNMANRAPGAASVGPKPGNPSPQQTIAPKPNTAPAQPAKTAAPTQPATTQPVAKTAAPTTSAQPAKTAPGAASATATPKRKPMVYGSDEYNKTAKQFGIKDDSQKSTAELQAESKARMGRINDLVSQLHNKTPMQKKVEASQAHYNTLTNNGTQSVPAGAKPTTVWSNNGDVGAAKKAATAQRTEMFDTKKSTTPPPATTQPATTNTTQSAPTPGQNIAKER
jgi:hypothetical protein